MLGVGPVHQVVIDWTVGSSKRVLVGNPPAKVEEGAPGVVEEDPECAALPKIDEEGNTLVDRIGGLLPAESVGIPHGEDLARTIEWARFVAESKKMRVIELLFVNVKAVAVPLNRTHILLQDFPREIGYGEAERRITRHAKRGGMKSHATTSDLGYSLDGCYAGFGKDCPGGILGKLTFIASTNPQYIV